jgi:hypothetical protein
MCGAGPKAIRPAFAGDKGAAWTEIPQRTNKPAQIAMMRTISLHCFSAAYDSDQPPGDAFVATDIDAGAMSSGRGVPGAWRNSAASAIR